MPLTKPVDQMDEKEVAEQLRSVGGQLTAIRDKYKGKDAEPWSAEDNEAFDRVGADWDALKERDQQFEAKRKTAEAKLKREQLLGDVDRRLSSNPNRDPGRDDFDGRDDAHNPSQRDHYDALQGWCRAGTDDGPSQRQRDAAKRCNINLNRRGFSFHLAETEVIAERGMPQLTWPRVQRDAFNRRNLSAGTAGSGGYTIPSDMVLALEEQLLSIGGPRQVASIIRTADGRPLNWPGADDTGNEGEQLGEASSIGDSVDPSFTQKTWNAYKYSSKVIKISSELLEDSPFNLAAWIFQKLGERIARIQGKRQTTGTGSSQPQGCTLGISAGVTAAATNAITADELIDLSLSVEDLYLQGDRVAWMMHKNTAGKIRKLKNSNNDYIWTPGFGLGIPDQLLQYPVILNSYMASSLAASGKSVVFGNFEKYGIRDIGSIRLRRLDERFADTDEVAFVAFHRMDAKWINTAAAKYLVQAAS